MNTHRDRIEGFMRDDARVASFAMGEANGRLEVAVTVAPDWVVGERAKAHADLSSRIVKQWQMVYDRSYRWDKEVRPPNFDAWISSFTAEPIPIERMRIWLDDALARMRSVPHGRVLELGCGVGLVLAALAPGGVAYHGIDVSEEAIASLGAWVATQPTLSHVRLAQRAAHELEGLDVAGVELAILNSVVQYFPDADYLVSVLGGAAERLVEGGAIFLGDMRAAALLPMRATCVAAARSKAGATVADVRADAAEVLGQARELAIDPGFFDTLDAALPRLDAVHYSLKPATADHELSGYRFDAMLRFDAPQEAEAPAWQAEPLPALLGRLDDERPDAVAICAIANGRLAHDVALTRAIADAAPTALVADLERSLELDAGALEPGTLAAAAAERGYAAELRFTPGSSEGRFDVLLRRAGVPVRWPGAATGIAFINDPLGDELAHKLRRDLQASLDAELGGRGFARVALRP